jgi:hypothetical protein
VSRGEQAAHRPQEYCDGLRSAVAAQAARVWDFSHIPLHRSLHENRLNDAVAGHHVPSPAQVAGPGAPSESNGEGGGATPRLSKSDETPATAGACGQFSWGIKWALDKPTTKGRWIVQKVQLSRAEVFCGTAAPDVHQFVFWEAWQVNKGKSVTADAQQGSVRDDAFLNLKPANSTGTLTYIGKADFHEGIGDIAKFGFKNRHKPPTGDLPMTTTDPGLPPGTGSIPHSIAASWDCCAKGKGASQKTKITLD